MTVLVLAAAAAAVARAAARPWLAGRDGSRWQVPASTAWSWRSRFAGRAGVLREGLMALLPLAAGPGAARALVPAGSAAGDCLAALEAVTAGLRRFGGLAAVTAHEPAAHLTGGPVAGPGGRVQHEAGRGGRHRAFVTAASGPGSGYPVMNRASRGGGS